MKKKARSSEFSTCVLFVSGTEYVQNIIVISDFEKSIQNSRINSRDFESECFRGPLEYHQPFRIQYRIRYCLS